MNLRKILPDKLQHQQLVKIRIQQRPHNRVQLPVMVMRPLRKVHIHVGILTLSLPTVLSRADSNLAMEAINKIK
jgi:hypothetical protein